MVRCIHAAYDNNIHHTGPEAARVFHEGGTAWVSTYGRSGSQLRAVPSTPSCASRLQSNAARVSLNRLVRPARCDSRRAIKGRLHIMIAWFMRQGETQPSHQLALVRPAVPHSLPSPSPSPAFPPFASRLPSTVPPLRPSRSLAAPHAGPGARPPSGRPWPFRGEPHPIPRRDLVSRQAISTVILMRVKIFSSMSHASIGSCVHRNSALPAAQRRIPADRPREAGL